MNVNRRKFFGIAAASPLAAKEVAARMMEAAEMEMSGMSLHSNSLYTGFSTGSFDEDDDTPLRSMWDAFRELGLPEWKKDDLWDDAKRSRTIDPDIASMSLTIDVRQARHAVEAQLRAVDRAGLQDPGDGA